MNKKGITFIEIIITISILGALTGMGMASYLGWQRQSKLIDNSDVIKSALVRAQQLATAAASSTDWGIHLETDSYVLFSGSFYDENNADNIRWYLSGVEIYEPSLSFDDGAGARTADVVFDKFTGLTSNAGVINIILISNPSVGREIEVFASGKID
jgi:type II secretory pathway pseudopilin PulG